MASATPVPRLGRVRQRFRNIFLRPFNQSKRPRPSQNVSGNEINSDPSRDAVASVPRLCQRCQKWSNVESLFDFMKEMTIMPLKEMAENKDCISCHAVASLVFQSLGNLDQDLSASDILVHMGSAFIVHPYSLQDDAEFDVDSYLSAIVKERRPLKCVIYLQVHEDQNKPKPNFKLSWHWWSQPDIVAQVLLHYESSSGHLNKIQLWDTPLFDTRAVKNWITTCEHDHGDQCYNSATDLPRGFRVIDIDNMCVIETPERPRFVALSYMWYSPLDQKDLQLGQNNLHSLSQHGSIQLSELPDIIADTITLCKDLGERYLWVDRLCIVQDDSQAKHVQINAMDAIYGMAAFAVVAAVEGTHMSGLPGVRGRPRRSFLQNRARRFNAEQRRMDIDFALAVDQSAWNSRGWTFQERVLSPRCLYISDHQVYFTCSKVLCQEDLGTVSRKQKSEYGFAGPGHYDIPDISGMTTVRSYVDCIPHYCTRKFSFDTDVLNAFAGIANRLSKNMETRFLHGLPERNLVQAMLWYQTHSTRRRNSVPDIPTWSWAAWLGDIEFVNRELPLWFDTGMLVTFYYQDAHRGLQPMEVEETWFGKVKNFEELMPAQNPVHIGNTNYMPDAAESTSIWLSCLQNPWERKVHEALDPEACELAREYLGSLLFNTTVASLSLKIRETTEDDADMVSLDICNDLAEPIGHIQLSSRCIREEINPDEKYDFIIICAGILAKHTRRDLFHRQYFDKVDLEKDTWILRGLLVERNVENGVARRVGSGYVETRLWNTARPRWETVILA